MLVHMNRRIVSLEGFLFTPYDLDEVIRGCIDSCVRQNLVRRKFMFGSALRLRIHCVVERWHGIFSLVLVNRPIPSIVDYL